MLKKKTNNITMIMYFFTDYIFILSLQVRPPTKYKKRIFPRICVFQMPKFTRKVTACNVVILYICNVSKEKKEKKRSVRQRKKGPFKSHLAFYVPQRSLSTSSSNLSLPSSVCKPYI